MVFISHIVNDDLLDGCVGSKGKGARKVNRSHEGGHVGLPEGELTVHTETR